MFCPNGHDKFVIGPEYIGRRLVAIMTCLRCGSRFDAFAHYGTVSAKSGRGAA